MANLVPILHLDSSKNFYGHKMTGILNWNNQVYVYYEYDAIWIIYSIWKDMPIKPYIYENISGFENKLRTCKETVKGINKDYAVDE